MRWSDSLKNLNSDMFSSNVLEGAYEKNDDSLYQDIV